jgi:hypothetical protein
MPISRAILFLLATTTVAAACVSSTTTSTSVSSPKASTVMATSTTLMPSAISATTTVATATTLSAVVSAPTVSTTKVAPTSAPPALTTSSVGASFPTAPTAPSTFTAEVWADNWFSLYVNGTFVGEDSVPITTERSFNSDTITFTASYPLTIAMVTKDFKENDTGLEYIATNRQQMGDAGFIAQITDTATGKVVAVSNTTWRGLVIHQAPTNKDCAKSPSPETVCKSTIGTEPAGWAAAGFNDAAWPTATKYTEAEVGTKDGYNAIMWDPLATLIWSSDLVSDNTVLWRTTIG